MLANHDSNPQPPPQHSIRPKGSWATGPGLPQCVLHFPVFPALSCCSALKKTSFILRPCTKHRYLPRFRLFVQHACARMWNKTRCQKRPVHVLFGDDALNAGTYRVSASLYNILRKDVEEEKLSQASCLWRPSPEHRYLQRFLPLCTTY